MDATRTLAVVFGRHGRAASYQPSTIGAPVACTVIMNSADDSADFGGSALIVAHLIVEVRKSEIAAPIRGGLFTIDGDVYRIAGAPKRTDPDRLIWTCACDPQ